MVVTAYGDESVRRRGVTVPVYLLGVYIDCNSGSDPVSAVLPYKRGRKLHWRDTAEPVKRRICQALGERADSYLIVAAAPLVDGVREERARQLALATLLVLLEEDYSVSRLVLERRDRAQDDKDRAVWMAMVQSRAVSATFMLEHAFGDEEPRLWIPDQIVGAYGDALTGEGRAWACISSTVRVEKLDLL